MNGIIQAIKDVDNTPIYRVCVKITGEISSMDVMYCGRDPVEARTAYLRHRAWDKPTRETTLEAFPPLADPLTDETPLDLSTFQNPPQNFKADQED